MITRSRASGLFVTSLALATGTALALTGCAASATSSAGKTPDQVVSIGVLVPFSGPLQATAKQEIALATLAAQTENSSGRLNGLTIKIVTLDTQLSPATAVQQFTRAVTSENVIGFVGPTNSGEALAVKPLASRYKKPVILIGATDDGLTEPASQYIFRVSSTFTTDVAAASGVMKDQKCRKPGLIYDDSSFGEGYAKDFLADKSHVAVIAQAQFSQASTSLTSQLQTMQAAGVDCIIAPTIAVAALGSMVKQMAATAFSVPIISNSAVVNSTFIQSAGSGTLAKVRVFGTSVVDFAGPRATKAFAKYIASGNPAPTSDVAVAGYDAVMLLASALEKARSTDGDKIGAALQKTNPTQYTSVAGQAGSTSPGFSAHVHDWITKSDPPYIVKVEESGAEVVKIQPAK